MKYLIAIFVSLILLSSEAQATNWELWQDFLAKHYQNGRIIDHSETKKITTSEGQSYALFFALVSNDKTTFDALLRFTEVELAGGSFKDNLPAWLYGLDNKGNNLLDKNNATDSDLWIAYDLLEAARIWQIPEYKEKALYIISNIKQKCIYHHSILGNIILPGAQGFVKENDSVVLNASYYPPFVLERIAQEDHDFITYYTDTMQAILRGSMQGFAEDWTELNSSGHLVVNPDSIGSYNAIRVYLWLGMTNKADPNRRLLLPFYQRMLAYARNNLEAPETANLYTFEQYGHSGTAFDAALVPLANDRQLNYLRTKMYAQSFTANEYYTHVLALFADGYDNHRFSFNANGNLHVGP